jgi:hypothetical protein
MVAKGGRTRPVRLVVWGANLHSAARRRKAVRRRRPAPAEDGGDSRPAEIDARSKDGTITLPRQDVPGRLLLLLRRPRRGFAGASLHPEGREPSTTR